MRTTSWVVFAAATGVFLACTVVAAVRGPSVYQDSVYGFSINAPAFPAAGKGANVVPVVMMAPADEGFSSNVNVSVQTVAVSRDAYRDLSTAQFKQAGWKVNAQRNATVSGKDAIFWDYEGTQGGKELRWLALTVVDTDRVYIITCTALKEAFPKYEKEFQACLNSFRLK
jgi:hypothetical protein